MTHRLSTRVQISTLFLCIILFFFFRPADYVIGSALNTLFSYAMLPVMFVMLLIAGLNIKNKIYRPNVVTIFILLLFGWCLVGSTIINSNNGNNTDIAGGILTFATVCSFVLICDINLATRPKKFMYTFMLVGTIMCSLNAITMFIYGYKGGMNPEIIQYGRRLTRNYFLLSEDNASFFWTWPVMLVTWFYYYLYNNSTKMRIWAITYTVLVCAGYIYMWSVMAMLGCLIVPIAIILFDRSIKKQVHRKNNHKKRKQLLHASFTFSCYWVTGFAFNILLATQRIISLFAEFITIYLKKDLTLSGRTQIWEKSFYHIQKSPIIGYGYEDFEYTLSKISINHTHNMYIETLYVGGIIALIFLILLFISLSLKAHKISKSPLYHVLMLMILFFILSSSIEFAFYRYHYLILFILMAHTELYTSRKHHRAVTLMHPV